MTDIIAQPTVPLSRSRQLLIEQMLMGKTWAYAVTSRGPTLQVLAVAVEGEGVMTLPMDWCRGLNYEGMVNYSIRLNKQRGMERDEATRIILAAANIGG